MGGGAEDNLKAVHQIFLSLSARPSQPPPANLDSMFLDIEEVMDVSSRLLNLLDQGQVRPGEPLFLQTLCKEPFSCCWLRPF